MATNKSFEIAKGNAANKLQAFAQSAVELDQQLTQKVAAIQKSMQSKNDADATKQAKDGTPNQKDQKSNKKISQSLLAYYTQEQQPVKGYKFGDFVSFAKKVETQMNQKQALIKKITKQAVLSYQKQIVENEKEMKKMLEFQESQKQLMKQFGNSEEKMRQFIANQLQFTLNQIKKEESLNLQDVIKRYARRKKAMVFSAEVDGKFLAIKQLKIKERFYHDNSLFLPTTAQNLYIKIQQGVLTKVSYKSGQYLDKMQLKRIDERMKEEIAGMILLYLKDQKILVQKDQQKDIYRFVHQFMAQLKKNNLELRKQFNDLKNKSEQKQTK